MTPPHSPSFAEASSTTSRPVQPAPLSDSQASPLTPETEPPCVAGRAMVTSVIRHTADSLAAPPPPPPACTQPTETSTPPPEALPEEKDGPPPSPALPPSSSSSSSPVSPVLCQVFPVSGRTGMISAFVQAPVQVQTQGGPKPILPQSSSGFAQPLLVGSTVPQGTVMFVVPQPPVSQSPVVTLGNTKLLPLAPAPVYIPSGAPSGASQADFSRRRNYVCNFPGCKKTYFKSSHLKAHLRTHTGEAQRPDPSP